MSKSKRNKAVALKYTPETDEAPLVIASGYGKVADKIIDVAEQNGIPVFRDDSTASLLCMLEVGSAIPSQLYEVIAAIYVQLVKTSAEIKQTARDNIYSRMRLDRARGGAVAGTGTGGAGGNKPKNNNDENQ